MNEMAQWVAMQLGAGDVAPTAAHEHTQVCPVQELWLAVLRQAVADARVASPVSSEERAEARSFLAGADGALEHVCGALGIDAGYFLALSHRDRLQLCRGPQRRTTRPLDAVRRVAA